MGTQEEPAPPAVTLGDVTAVLELAGRHRDAAAPIPMSWDAVLDQIRAVLVVPVGGPAVSAAEPASR